jgi:hypothetical protein
MAKHLCIKLFPLVFFMLWGCSLPMVAIDQERNELFHGTLSHNPVTGSAYVELHAQGSNIRCRGTALMNYSLQTTSALGPGGTVLTCDDGRKINGSLTITGAESGFGSGKDQYGNKYLFSLGADQNIPVKPVLLNAR